jgi:hypothetical protein
MTVICFSLYSHYSSVAATSTRKVVYLKLCQVISKHIPGADYLIVNPMVAIQGTFGILPYWVVGEFDALASYLSLKWWALKFQVELTMKDAYQLIHSI